LFLQEQIKDIIIITLPQTQHSQSHKDNPTESISVQNEGWGGEGRRRRRRSTCRGRDDWHGLASQHGRRHFILCTSARRRADAAAAGPVTRSRSKALTFHKVLGPRTRGRLKALQVRGIDFSQRTADVQRHRIADEDCIMMRMMMMRTLNQGFPFSPLQCRQGRTQMDEEEAMCTMHAVVVLCFGCWQGLANRSTYTRFISWTGSNSTVYFLS
jgi:hypothetical protein